MTAKTISLAGLRIACVTLLIMFMGGVSDARAQALQMVAEPIYPKKQSHDVYSQLAEYLSDKLNKKILLTISVNFQQHWLLTKQGDKPDIVIEQAPLTDYWSYYRGYTPLVKNMQSTRYSLVTLKPEYRHPNDLFMLPVASMPSPSTGYLILTQWYKNPLSQPEIISNSTSWQDSVQQLWDGIVEAAIIPTSLAKNYPQFRVIRNSDPMPGLSVSLAPHVESDLREKILRVLLALNDDAGNYPVLHELNITAFVPAQETEYRGYAEWLRTISSNGFPDIRE